MRSSSKISAVLLGLALGCGGNSMERPESGYRGRLIKNTPEKRQAIASKLAAVMGWYRTVENAQSDPGTKDTIKQCLDEHPEKFDALKEARAHVNELIADTAWDKCDPNGKSATDICRAKALVAKHCPDQIGFAFPHLTHEMETLPCLNLDNDNGRFFIGVAPGKMDVEDEIPSGFEQDWIWNERCFEPAKPKPKEKEPEIFYEETWPTSGATTPEVKKSPVSAQKQIPDYDSWLRIGILEADKLLITFATQDAIKDNSKGQRWVTQCLNNAAKQLTPRALGIFSQEWRKARTYNLFWLDLKIRVAIGEEEFTKFAIEYTKCLR